MENWTVKKVGDWLKANGFKKQVKIFKDRNIDGNALMKLTDDDIVQLLLEVNKDGTIQEPTIGMKSRFRTMLIEWKRENEQKKQTNQDETANVSSIIVPSNATDLTNLNEVKHQDDVVSKKSKKKHSDNDICEVNYLIEDDIHIQFLRNPKFLPYLINYIKQEIFSIEIDIKQVNSKDDESLLNYTVKLIGKKQQIRVVRSFIKNLFKSIKSKIYHQNKIRKWLFDLTFINIIQNILDNESHLFTLCQFSRRNNKILEIYYFDNEKFNSFQNPIEIDNIIQNQISEENIILSSNKHLQIIEHIDINSKKILSNYKIGPSKKYEEELYKNINQYEQDNMLISITRNPYCKNRSNTKQIIRIFGYRKFVEEILQKFKDLFDKYRLRKYKFSQFSSEQLDYLADTFGQALSSVGEEFQDGYVIYHLRQNQFYAPEFLKNEVQNFIISLLSNLNTKTLKTTEFYHDIADKLCSNIKNIAQQNHCYCELKLKTKLKSYSIPRSNENTLITSKSIIEQSNLLCSLPFVFCQTKLTHGSIDVLMGDIALQKVDIIIIPSTSFGLKENLIERAGKIIEQQSLNQTDQKENETNSMPFITETTGGELNCKKILFVNWSLPTMITNEDYLSDSIRLFISKSIQYVIMNSQQENLKIQSIAFAVPDSCKHEQILAEEMVEETINQINLTKSLSLKVSFILLPDQQTLHQQFLNVIQTIQTTNDNFGIFCCPASTITITLTSSNPEYFTECEKKINNYLKRSTFEMNLDGFQHWNQYMINAFYKYSNDKHVLPKLDNQQHIVLYGPINNVYEVYQRYQLINALIQEKTNLLSLFSTNISSTNFNIMLSYSQDDSIISHRLANRLIDEGFSVWMNSNQSTEFDQILRKIKKSDCIILCISENYFQNELCEKEAKYIDEIGKCMIPVKVQYYEPIEWLQKLIEKESYFQLFGSENHFNLEYDKLLLKICSKSLGTRSIYRFNGDKNLKTLLNIPPFTYTGDINNAVFPMLDETLQNSYLLFSLCQHYSMPNESDSLSNKNNSSSTSRSSTPRKIFISKQLEIPSVKVNINRIYSQTTSNQRKISISSSSEEEIITKHREIPSEKVNIDQIDSQTTSDQRKSSIISSSEEEIITKHREIPSEKVNTDQIDSQTTSDQRKSSIISSSEEKIITKKSRKRKESKINYKPKIIIPEKHFIRNSLRENEKLEFKLKFAEQHQKNEYEFQKFCKDYEHSMYLLSKQNIHHYPTVIFGPCPFSNIKTKPRKTVQTHNKIELPLKFPWNGVSDTTIPSVIRKDPSIFFFFEVSSSEKN
ncbi:unnamed protein product [Rotaria sordida]|uniref:SAM domain-containing protein n=1 Tax=Rotaria sordida TaxID=392033 RepID=A0A818TIB1_9BILA|nr:unnamed protein product [Rotaria sordida]